MSKSIWSIVVMGLVASMLLVLGMFLSLSQFQTSPAGMRTKLAELIRAEFKFEIAGADVTLEGSKRILRVAYETHADSKFDFTVQRAEMQKVAEFALARYEGSDRAIIDEAKVTRSEVRGRGCFQETYVTHHVVANPRRQPVNPFQMRPP